MTTDDFEISGEDERAARTAWLLTLSADQIAHFGTGDILDWLDARREQHVSRLRAACRTLRHLNVRQAQAHARLAARTRAPEEPTR
ncbi:hypothetical protein ABZ609_03435 [Streptomyces rubiginosohelvolus]|uniref:hypothetical protein n=1 Tax=Streptomyces rubiginosohelvolus TaxID=67362 RepID=UPI0033EAFE6B